MYRTGRAGDILTRIEISTGNRKKFTAASFCIVEFLFLFRRSVGWCDIGMTILKRIHRMQEGYDARQARKRATLRRKARID